MHAHVPAGIGQSFLHGSCQTLAADTCPRNRGNSGEPCCQVANSWDSFPGDMTQRLQHIRERAPEDPETIFKAVVIAQGRTVDNMIAMKVLSGARRGRTSRLRKKRRAAPDQRSAIKPNADFFNTGIVAGWVCHRNTIFELPGKFARRTRRRIR